MPPKAVVAVLDEAGATVAHHPFELTQQISPTATATLNNALEVVMQRGTGKGSRFRNAGVAGKTGRPTTTATAGLPVLTAIT